MPTIAGGVVRPHPLKAPAVTCSMAENIWEIARIFRYALPATSVCGSLINEYFFTKEQEGQAGDQGDSPGEFQRVMVSQAYTAQVAGPEVLSREGC